jgi:MYXO-CTERM domain-containing protein
MKPTLTCACALIGVFGVCADPFRNLGFEEASTNGCELFLDFSGTVLILAGRGPAATLLPGWTTSGVSTVGLNWSPLGGSSLTLWTDTLRGDDPRLGTVSLDFLFPGAEGHFALAPSGDYARPPQSIWQRGDIPADARLLNYNCFHRQIDVSINGNLSTGPSNYWGASDMLDISPYAGQNVELKFTTRTGPWDGTTSGLDDIRFMIPEPAPWLLAAIGALALAAGRRRRRSVRCRRSLR